MELSADQLGAGLRKNRMSHRLTGWRCDSADAIGVHGDTHLGLPTACGVGAGNEDVWRLHGTHPGSSSAVS